MRTTTFIALFMLLVSATMSFGTAAGIWADWGVQSPAPGLEKQVEKTNDQFRSINSGNLGVESFVNAAFAVVQILRVAFEIVTVAPSALALIGVPNFIADLVGAGVFVIWGGDMIAIYLGREV